MRMTKTVQMMMMMLIKLDYVVRMLEVIIQVSMLEIWEE